MELHIILLTNHTYSDVYRAVLHNFGGKLEENYENGQNVVYTWQIGNYVQYSSERSIYRGTNSLGHYILENPANGAVFLVRTIAPWEGEDRGRYL